MNCKVTIKEIRFEINDDFTVCKIWFDSEDPILTQNYRSKSFSKKMSIVDILQKEVPNYLLWE